MNRGYVKIWRKSADSAIFSHDGLWKLFCLCLLKASHKETEVTIPSILKPIQLKPGQFITGRHSLHEDYHQAHLKKRYSRKAAPTAITLYRWLLILQEMQILNINSYNKYSIITVINWHLYQSNEQQMNNRRTTDEHKQEYNKNIYSRVVAYLNKKTGKSFSPKTKTTKSHINARISEGYTEADFFTVIDNKCEKWMSEQRMRDYLRPQTLFGPKFESYLNDIPENQEPTNSPPHPIEITAENAERIYEN